MTQTCRSSASLVCLLTLVCLPCGEPRIAAAPFTRHFDELISILSARAAGLGENPDKAARKLESGVQKALKALGKTSSSLATDVKSLGKIAKSLNKLFPGDLANPSSDLRQTLAKVVDGLEGDVERIVDGAQSVLDGVGGSSCKTKANASLSNGASLLASVDSAAAAGDFVGAAKLLKSAHKVAAKGDKAARSKKCAVPGDGSGNGNGNGDGDGNGNNGGNDPPEFLRADISGSVQASFAALGALETDATYDSFVNQLSVYGTDNAKLLSLLIAVRDVTGPDKYPIHSSSSFTDLSTGTLYSIQVSGTVTFTVVDFQKPELVGTFEVTYQQFLPTGTGSITAKQGRFRVLNINGRPGTGG